MTTRRDKARELWRQASEGPTLRISDGLSPETQAYIREEIRQGYAAWAEIRLLPLLTELIPELRERGFFVVTATMAIGPFDTEAGAQAYVNAHPAAGWRVEKRP